MFSAPKNPETRRNPDREAERSGLTLNLTVRGSPAPACLRRPESSAERGGAQPAPEERRRKEPAFPVEKIIYLAERLQLTTLAEKKVEAVALSSVDVEGRRGGRLTRRGEGFGFPQGFDFSLDLSSVSDAGDASDGRCDDFEEGTSPSPRCGGDKWCGSACSDEEACETSRAASVSRGSSSEADGGGFRDCECAGRGVSAGNLDLVHLYVNSVDNQEELVKYFRPYSSCRDACSACSDSSSRTTGPLGPHPKDPRDGPRGFGRINKAVETDARVTGFAFECASPSVVRRRFGDSECCFSRLPETDFLSPLCGGGCARSCRCRCRCGCGCEAPKSASDDSFGSAGVHGYASGLARATQSARDLVRDLEFILGGLDGGTE